MDRKPDLVDVTDEGSEEEEEEDSYEPGWYLFLRQTADVKEQPETDTADRTR